MSDTLSTAQSWPSSSCSKSRGGIEAYIAFLPLHAPGQSPLAWGQWWQLEGERHPSLRGGVGRTAVD